jgi:hypothetical protein
MRYMYLIPIFMVMILLCQYIGMMFIFLLINDLVVKIGYKGLSKVSQEYFYIPANFLFSVIHFLCRGLRGKRGWSF